MDVIYATVTNSEDPSSMRSRICLNAAEMGVAGEIIDRSKKVREVVNSRIVSTITSMLRPCRPIKAMSVKFLLIMTAGNLLSK